MKLLKVMSTIFFSLNSTGTLTTKLSIQSFVASSAHYSQKGSLLRRNPGVYLSRRTFSSAPHNISCSGNEEDDNEEHQISKAPIPVTVKAFFLSTSVNLRTLVEQHNQNFIIPSSPMTNYVVLRFGNLNLENGPGANLSWSDCCYMIVSQYGSIVLFNILDHEVDGYLKIVERHASGLLPELRKDEYELRENSALNTLVQRGPDYIMLQYLNIEMIRIIGSVLGQSITLDYYIHQVDEIITEFYDINREMEGTGTLKVKRKKAYQLVGRANSHLTDIILKLGLFERSDVAWRDAEYAKIWEHLRDEFDLTRRFASLDFKFKFVEHNIRFLQEILHRKTKIMECILIIVLVSELVSNVCDIFNA